MTRLTLFKCSFSENTETAHEQFSNSKQLPITLDLNDIGCSNCVGTQVDEKFEIKN